MMTSAQTKERARDVAMHVFPFFVFPFTFYARSLLSYFFLASHVPASLPHATSKGGADRAESFLCVYDLRRLART